MVPPQHNLCTPGGDLRKVSAFKDFLTGDGRILVCTHATLRFAFEQLNGYQHPKEAGALLSMMLRVDMR